MSACKSEGSRDRERHLGPGPWPILRSGDYIPTPDADPIYLYSDVLIGIVPERGLINGMPSYHMPLMASADIRAGDHVVHIGAGVGYYTAIMACLAGSAGRVTAIEFDAALASRAATNFSNAANIHVLQGDGFSMLFDMADVIYVNAGATHPADIWLDRLNDGGRLILPLTAKKTLPPGATGPISRHGAVFRIERKGDVTNFSPVGFLRSASTRAKEGAMMHRKPLLTRPYKQVAGAP
jgi:protein-L-isoaspartate(D-aspartate) O-methyltransferase